MKTVLSFVLVLFGLTILAQKPAKKVLSINDFANWNVIAGSQISNNGKIVAYEINKQKGDGNLIIKHETNSDTIARGNGATISPDNDFVVFNIKQPEEKIRKAKLDKVKNDNMPKDSLGIFLFKNNTLIKYPKVKSYKIAEKNAQWIAFLMEPTKAAKDTTKKEKVVKPKNTPKQPGDNLVIFELQSEDTLAFKNVVEYSISKNGNTIFFVQQTKDTINTFSTLNIFDTETERVKELFTSAGWLKKAVLNESGDNYAFIFSQDTTKEKVYSLYSGSIQTTPEILVKESSQGIPIGFSPSENGNIYFSKDDSKLYFETAKSVEIEPKDTLLAEDKPKVDIWNWKDLKLQSQQLKEVEREKKRTFLAVYYFDLKKIIQLADLNIRNISTIQKGNGDVGLGYDEIPYLRETSWTGKRSRDYYLVDFVTGIKREIVKEKSLVVLSPTGKYIVWYEPNDSSYYAKSTDINKLDVISLTKIIPVSFYDELNDRPMEPSPYGIAGWSEEDKFVYIYDHFDIWKIDPSGVKVPVCVTKAFGRRNQTRLRYTKLDLELDHIPSNETILLSAFDERTMSQGYFGTKLNTIKDPDLLIMEKVSFGRSIQKAKEADKILWTKQNVKMNPDLWSSNLKFEQAIKTSDANPQINEFVWPTVELVEWNSFSGEKLKGLLYKPENLDVDKKYPMMVYFYERSSEGLYRHNYPKPSNSTINIPFYVSNGYLVFVPDITYKTGYPGQSAYNAIVSGTQYLTNNFKFINKNKIGLQGQSWGGYQAAYLITQTDMYAAAMAGAPVSNMTSAYGGIRWGTGISRMAQYEHTQSRIGGTLWEKTLLYLDNSPVFHVPKINTPLLMMHNDNDGAVPWWQGIEMFVAMRRLDKPVWMLTYNGEDHNLPNKSWANRVDLSTRMFQFFNHYLKDKPAPEWMIKGIPAIDKGENLGY